MSNKFGNEIPPKKLQPSKFGVIETPTTGPHSPYNIRAFRNDDVEFGDISLVPEAYPRRSEITRVREIEGHVVCRHDPSGFWKTVAKRNGQPVPSELAGTYTSLDEFYRALLNYKGEAN